MRIARIVARIVLPALLVSACGGEEGPTAPSGSSGPSGPSSPPQPTGQVGNFPVGAYEKTLNAQDLPNLTALRSHWRIEWMADGRFEVFQDGASDVTGTFEVTDDVITLRDNGGSGACRPGTEIGQYRWSLNGDDLTFVRVADACRGRPEVITTKPWIRQ